MYAHTWWTRQKKQQQKNPYCLFWHFPWNVRHWDVWAFHLDANKIRKQIHVSEVAMAAWQCKTIKQISHICLSQISAQQTEMKIQQSSFTGFNPTRKVKLPLMAFSHTSDTTPESQQCNPNKISSMRTRILLGYYFTRRHEHSTASGIISKCL